MVNAGVRLALTEAADGPPADPSHDSADQQHEKASRRGEATTPWRKLSSLVRRQDYDVVKMLNNVHQQTQQGPNEAWAVCDLAARLSNFAFS